MWAREEARRPGATCEQHTKIMARRMLRQKGGRATAQRNDGVKTAQNIISSAIVTSNPQNLRNCWAMMGERTDRSRIWSTERHGIEQPNICLWNAEGLKSKIGNKCFTDYVNGDGIFRNAHSWTEGEAFGINSINRHSEEKENNEIWAQCRRSGSVRDRIRQSQQLYTMLHGWAFTWAECLQRTTCVLCTELLRHQT